MKNRMYVVSYQKDGYSNAFKNKINAKVLVSWTTKLESVDTAILTKQYKASLDVPVLCDLQQGARICVGVRTWVCSAGEYRTRNWPRKRTLHARTCAHARSHALVNPCTYTSRRRPPAKSAISQKPQLLTGERNRVYATATAIPTSRILRDFDSRLYLSNMRSYEIFGGLGRWLSRNYTFSICMWELCKIRDNSISSLLLM